MVTRLGPAAPVIVHLATSLTEPAASSIVNSHCEYLVEFACWHLYGPFIGVRFLP